MEYLTTRHTAGVHATGQNECPASLVIATVDLKDLEAWCITPNVTKGNRSELAPPIGSNAAAEKERVQFVAEIFPALKTRIREFPHTIYTLDPLWLCKHILKSTLK